MSTKKFVLAVIANLCILLYTSNVLANPSFAKGRVLSIYAGDDGIPGIGLDWAYIDASAFSPGTICPTLGNTPYVILKIQDDERGKRQFTTLLSAQLTGRMVQVSVDSSQREDTPGSACLLRWVRIL